MNTHQQIHQLKKENKALREENLQLKEKLKTLFFSSFFA